MGKVRALGSDQHKETVKKPYWIRRPSPPIQRPLFGSPSGSWLRFTITSRTRTTVYPLAAASAQACLHLHAALPWRDFFLFVINRVLQTCKDFLLRSDRENEPSSSVGASRKELKWRRTETPPITWCNFRRCIRRAGVLLSLVHVRPSKYSMTPGTTAAKPLATKLGIL